MKFRKTVSAIAALATVCSAFAIAPVANAYTAEERTTYYMNAETYDSDDSSDGWTGKHFSSTWTNPNFYFGSFGEYGHGVGIKNGTLFFNLNNSNLHNYNATKEFGETVTSGIVGVKTDFSYQSDMYSTDACYISFKNSKKEEIARLTISMDGTVALGSKNFKAAVDITSTNWNEITYYTYTPVIEFMVDIDKNTATLVYTSDKTETKTLTTTIEDVSDIAYFEVGSVSIFKSGQIKLDNTTLYSYKTTEAWQFENLPISDYNSNDSQLCFDISYLQDGNIVEATTNNTVSAIIDSYATSDSAKTYLSGSGNVTFGIIITNIDLNQSIHKVYITPAENSEIELASGTFEADAEIDESEFIEIGDSEFDVE